MKSLQSSMSSFSCDELKTKECPEVAARSLLSCINHVPCLVIKDLWSLVTEQLCVIWANQTL